MPPTRVVSSAYAPGMVKGGDDDEAARECDDEERSGPEVAGGDDTDEDEGSQTIGVLQPDGSWKALETRKRDPSGDPEIEALYEMPMDKLQAILDDPLHPLHEKARVVVSEIMAPVREGFRKIVGDSGFARAFAPISEQLKKAAQAALPHVPEVPSSIYTQPEFELPDFTPAPDPTWDVLDEQREMNAKLGTLIETMAEMLDVAKKDSKAAATESVEQRRISRHALGWTIAATLTALLIGVVTIWVTLVAAGAGQDDDPDPAVPTVTATFEPTPAKSAAPRPTATSSSTTISSAPPPAEALVQPSP